MNINGLIFFEARKHVGNSGFVLHVRDKVHAPGERKDLERRMSYFSI